MPLVYCFLTSFISLYSIQLWYRCSSDANSRLILRRNPAVLVSGWCLEPQWVAGALGVTGTPSVAGDTPGWLLPQQRARFPVNFRNIGAAEQAAPARSDVCTQVGTTRVHSFLGSLGFWFLPNSWAVLFVRVFQPNLQLWTALPVFPGGWETPNLRIQGTEITLGHWSALSARFLQHWAPSFQEMSSTEHQLLLRKKNSNHWVSDPYSKYLCCKL